jgi:O-antigen/teichoic acid export membrane protein
LERFLLLNSAELLLATISTMTIAIAAALHRLTPTIAVVAVGAANAIGAMWVLRALSPSVSWSLKRDVLWSSLRYGVRPYVVCVAGFLVTRFDLLFINTSRGSAVAGYYSVALTITGLLSTLPVIVGQVLFPRLTRMPDIRARWRLAVRATCLTAIIMGPIAVILAAFAPSLLGMVFGRPFAEAGVALVWLLPGVVLLATEVVLVQYLNSIGYPLSLVGAWIATAALNLGLNAVLIPRFGIRGAGTASSLTYLALFGIVVALAMRHVRRTTLDSLPTRQTVGVSDEPALGIDVA